MSYVVKLRTDVGDILCSRPYPRPDHLDPFTYKTRCEALRFARSMADKFPANHYIVVPE